LLENSQTWQKSEICREKKITHGKPKASQTQTSENWREDISKAIRNQMSIGKVT
jgi:hypothetical protein